MVRPASFDSNGMKKGAWSEDEDNKLRAYVLRYGHWNWRLLPKYAGLARCGKSCRLRWVNYLKPGLKRGNFTKQEEELIAKLHQAHGNKWSAIAANLPGRTDNEIKNHWHTNINKTRRLNRKNIQTPKNNINLHKSTSESCNSEVTFEDALEKNHSDISTWEIFPLIDQSTTPNPMMINAPSGIDQNLGSNIFDPKLSGSIVSHGFDPSLFPMDTNYPNFYDETFPLVPETEFPNYPQPQYIDQFSSSGLSVTGLDMLGDNDHSNNSLDSMPQIAQESFWWELLASYNDPYISQSHILTRGVGEVYNPLLPHFFMK